MNNTFKPLFSDYYLTKRLQSTSDWQVDITANFQELQNRYEQKKNILPNLNESQTEEEWIKPILDCLGFSYIVQTSSHKSAKIQRPDYSLFIDENSKQTAYNNINDEALFYRQTVAIAEAKYYDRPLSEKLKNDKRDRFKNSNPSFQIVNYLDGTRVNWGILTNGIHWRLYYRLSSSPIQEYYEINLIDLLINDDVESFKYFWLFFRKDAFIKDRQNLNFLERVREESNNYAREIEGELKKLIFNEVFANLASGFIANITNTKIAPPIDINDNVDLIYQGTLSFLYKILFLLYAESRNLLPINQENYRGYSLSLLLKEIAEKCDQKKVFSETFSLYYDHLLNLFRMVDSGDKSLNVPVYNGGLFKLDFNPFFKRENKKFTTNQFLFTYKITDHILAPVLDQLARINGEYIDYKFLGVRDLGSIYEGLLEYRLTIDEEKPSKVHLENDKGERKETGSYYTPEYIVNYIVQNTLDPILEEREKQFAQLMVEIEQLLKDLQDSKKSAKTIKILRQDLESKKRQAYESLLDIKICDPAMGSGHFLVNAVDYLTRKLIIILNHYPDHNPILEQLEQIKQDIIDNLTNQGITVNENSLSPENLLHRAVMKRCIYGVDLNPMAVELAKVSLWLHSFTVGAPLSFLDHHLRCGNSLIGCMAKDVQNDFLTEEETTGILPLFQSPFAGLLQSASVMQEIANLSDATFAEVEQSQHYFNSFDEQVKPYKQLLDVYISQYFGLDKKEVDSFFRFRLNNLANDSLADVITNGNGNGKDQTLLDTAKNLYEEKRFFHWDLEFPEVFIDLNNSNWKENGGFDVVLGNPPYVRSIRLKEFDQQSWQYYPLAYQAAAKREYDIYLCFIEQSLKLIKNLSYAGLIIPNKWFTTRVGESIRNLLVHQKAIKSMVDFKDFQIFEEATTYICLLFLSKESNEQINLAILEDFSAKEEEEDDDENKDQFLPIPNIQGDWKLGLFNYDDLGINSWSFALDAEQSLLKKLAKLPKLEEIAFPFVGIGTTSDPIFRMEKRDNQFYSRSLKKLVEIEPDLMKSSLTGQNIDSYYYEDSSYLLFPYDDNYKLLNPKELGEKYPLAWSYLNDNTNKNILQNRENGKFLNKNNWYCYGRPQNIQLQKNPKIVFPDVANKARFTCDFKGHYIIDTVYAIQLKERVNFSLLALTTILNSSIMTFFLQQTGTNLRGGYFRMKTAYLNPFPIPVIDFTTVESEKKEAVNQLIEIYQNQVSQASSLSQLNHYKLETYLTENKTDIIHDFLAFLAQQMINYNQEKQTEIKDFLTWLAREIGTDIDNLTNKTKIKNYLGNYQKQEEHLTFKDLLQILKKNKKRLKIDPSERKIQNLLAKEYENSLNVLFPIKQRLKDTDNLIDKIVYLLYGLTEEEIKIIENT